MSKKRVKKRESTTCMKKTLNLLCPCISSKSTESLGEEIYPLQHDRDRYEYIVEKLAIKRVPLSLFGTSEDYKCCLSQSHTKKQQLFPGKNVNYHSYFVKTSSSPRSTGQPKIQSSSSNISVNYDKRKRPPFRMREPSQISRTREQEQEMVSHILNQYSSLYTLDRKEAIPKDPLTFPRQPRWHSPNCPTKMKPKKEVPKIPFRPNKSVVEAEVFECSNRALALPITANNVSMSHSMQQTIRALGSAQPYAKHFLPRNHRHCSPSERDEITETFIPKRVQSEELRCVQLDKEANLVVHKCQHKKVEKVVGDNVKQKYNVVQKIKADPPSKHSLVSRNEHAPAEHHFVDHPCLYYTTDPPSALMPKVIEEESHITVLPSNFSINAKRRPLSESDPRSYTTINRDFGDSYNGEEPVMEINHMKGPNLKWKIIIKHHDG